MTQAAAAVAAWLTPRMEADGVRVTGWSQLSGGAIQSNIALDVDVDGGAFAGSQRFVLRTDAATAVAASLDRPREYAVLRAAWEAGVRAPQPLFLCDDETVLGAGFFVMRRLPGVAAGRRIVRDATLVPDRAALAFELGENLARIHAIVPPRSELAALPAAAADHAVAAIAQYRRFLDAMNDAHPAIEWGLRWCELHAPTPAPATLIHRDYRTGNYLVDSGHLTGVLDWEFAGWGDPREDLGWFCARCWRFGALDREAGGIASIEPFVQGYAAGHARAPSREELDYWQVMAHLRWAVIALQQSRRHLTGGERSLELALTGRIVHELEHEIVQVTGRPPRTRTPVDRDTASGHSASRCARRDAAAPQDASSGNVAAATDIADGDELLASAGETLEHSVLPAVATEQRYPALMAARAIAIALREHRDGPAAAAAEAERVARLTGHQDLSPAPDRREAKRALAAAIREGSFDAGARHAALCAHLAETVRRDVAISNPAVLREIS